MDGQVVSFPNNRTGHKEFTSHNLAKALRDAAKSAMVVGRTAGDNIDIFGDRRPPFHPSKVAPVAFELGPEVVETESGYEIGKRVWVTFSVPSGRGHATFAIWLDPNALAGFLMARRSMSLLNRAVNETPGQASEV